MMNKSKGGTVDVIISKLTAKKPKPDAIQYEESPETESMEIEDHDLAYQAAAQEIFDAIEAKDSGMLIEALKAFIELCTAGE